jgi:hypothetical protein
MEGQKTVAFARRIYGIGSGRETARAVLIPQLCNDLAMGISPQGADHLRMKIGRAYKHVMEFDSLVVAHCRRTDLFAATGIEDMRSGRLTVRIEFPILDGDILLSLGDFVYNLRSGLDQLAWQLCLSGGGTPGRDTMFPIHEDEAKSEGTFLKRVCGMHSDAVAILREVQPYKRPDFKKHPLWQLNTLSNIEKHRLPIGRSTDTSFNIEPGGYTKTDFDNGMELSWPLSAKGRIKMESKTPKLTFGDPLDSFTTGDPLELTREDIAEIYRYVREDVAPRFERFLK